VKLTFLDPLYARPGPVACAYLDTSRDIDDPEKAIGLRRRHLREDLTAQGADTDTVAVVADTVGTDREVSGRHGQAIFAGRGHLLLAEELPQPPVRDTARFTDLPEAMPLVLQHAPDIPYAAVAVRDVGPAENGVVPEELEVEVQTGRWPMSTVAPGPRDRRRGPAAEWQRGAEQIVGELRDLVHRTGAEVVVLAGDAWARSVLLNRMPRYLHDRIAMVADRGIPAPQAGAEQGDGAGRALLEQELRELFLDRRSARDQSRFETFLAQRARHRGAAEGMAAVVAALQRGQAAAVLVNTPARFPAPLWVGTEPTEIALSAADLESFGVVSSREEPADAALLRALVRTGAELIVVPRDELPMGDGVGVLLRYADPGNRA
jgi:hypothetical protein